MSQPTHKSRLRPTPWMGATDAARWVCLPYDTAVMIQTCLMRALAQLNAKKMRPHEFPLTADQCREVMTRLDAQMPGDIPGELKTDLLFSLRETHLYCLRRWRVWLEDELATALQHTNTSTIVGYIDGQRIELAYRCLTDLRSRLAPPRC